MKMIIAVIKPHKLDEVQGALGAAGIGGMTVTEVRGYGRQKGHTEKYEGVEAAVGFVNKVKLDICVTDEMVGKVVDAITTVAGTGKVGDGKIFVYDVEKVVRIRTGETDAAAV